MTTSSPPAARGAATRQAARTAASRARPAVDLRPLLDPVLIAQGPRPVCVPFAVGAGHEACRAAHAPAGAPPEPLAPEAIWWYCSGRGQTSAQGVLLLDAGSALAQAGQPTMTTWPYEPGLGIGTQPPPKAVGQPPWHTAQLHEIALAHDGAEDQIEDTLAAGTPVILIIEITDEFYDADGDGHIGVPNLRVPPGDYHAVTVVGAATHPSRGRLLLLRNSWGEYWGAGGYGWLPITYLVAFAAQAAVVRTGGNP